MALIIVGTILTLACGASNAQVALSGPPPIRIKRSGSFFLKKNLRIKKTDVSGIEVLAPDVTINLNGNSILGPATGSGVGIDAHGQANLIVINGSVVSMGGAGIVAGDNAQFSIIHFDSNGIGVQCGNGCSVSGSTAHANVGVGVSIEGDNGVVNSIDADSNGGDGVDCGNNCVITNSTIGHNSGVGISVGSNATITSDVANSNEGSGIVCVGGNCQISSCNANANGTGSGGGSGIDCQTIGNCNIFANNANSNGSGAGGGSGIVSTKSQVSQNTANINQHFGIFAGSGSQVFNNTASGNGADGINVTGQSQISTNAVRNNGGDGINANTAGSTGNLASSNSANFNMGFGLDFLDNTSLFSGNTLNNNDGSSSGTTGQFNNGTSFGNLCNGFFC